ncbi:hypothetical protein EVAR_88578_1 [Eumeta japonica]|uniref:MADF domain-containing protein n=1 Tax=Eumeta variegata TaxID=151549 RepID=A0A4C1WLI4_EUMVA|nr:hypothetical protein EVAR_88578_1 [Eumeta japonica]
MKSLKIHQQATGRIESEENLFEGSSKSQHQETKTNDENLQSLDYQQVQQPSDQTENDIGVPRLDQKLKEYEEKAKKLSASVGIDYNDINKRRITPKFSDRSTDTALAGVEDVTTSIEGITCLTIRSRTDDSVRFTIQPLVVNRITNELPTANIDHTRLDYLNDLPLADFKHYKPTNIDLILGSDIFARVFCHKTVSRGTTKPVAVETLLVSLLAKLIIKSLWEIKIAWDDIPLQNIISLWNQFQSELPLLENVQLSRHVRVTTNCTVSILGFADASEKPYGGVHRRAVVLETTVAAESEDITQKSASETYISRWFVYDALKFVDDRNTPRKGKNTKSMRPCPLARSVTDQHRRMPCTERQVLSVRIFCRCRDGPRMTSDVARPGAQAAKQWQGLRDAYRRALNKKKGRTGQAAKKMKKWKYEEEMSFVASFFVEKRTIDSVDLSSDGEESQDKDAANEVQNPNSPCQINSGDTLDVAAFHDTKIQDEDDPIVRIKSYNHKIVEPKGKGNKEG